MKERFSLTIPNARKAADALKAALNTFSSGDIPTVYGAQAELRRDKPDLDEIMPVFALVYRLEADDRDRLVKEVVRLQDFIMSHCVAAADKLLARHAEDDAAAIDAREKLVPILRRVAEGNSRTADGGGEDFRTIELICDEQIQYAPLLSEVAHILERHGDLAAVRSTQGLIECLKSLAGLVPQLIEVRSRL